MSRAFEISRSNGGKATRTWEFCLQDGLNNGTTGVEIKVADIQNSPPEFLDSLTGVVREDDPIGTLVMTVKARDGDRGMPRKMIYELVTSEYSSSSFSSTFKLCKHAIAVPVPDSNFQADVDLPART